jgi:copper chaperone
MSTLDLTLPDMTCQHCVRTVTQTVKEIDAAATVDIDLPAHRVRIETTATAAALAAALTEQGYPPAA